jgi:hypothetical protein
VQAGEGGIMMGLDEREPRDTSEINLRVLKAAAEFASKDKDRVSLSGVCIELERKATTYIATDGVRLICLREEPAAENRVLGAFTVPTRHCKAFKLHKEDDGRTDILAAGPRLTIAHEKTDVTFMPIEAEFPDWRKAVPRTFACGVIAQYGFKALDTFRKFADALELPAPFLAPNGEGPGFVWFTGAPDVFGLIMPVRRVIDQLERRPAGWAFSGGPPRKQADVEDELLRHPPSEDDDAEDAKAGVH